MYWLTLPLVILIGLGGMLRPDESDPDTTEPVPHVA